MIKKNLILTLCLVPLCIIGLLSARFFPRFAYEIIPAWAIVMLSGLCFILTGYAIDRFLGLSKIVPVKISLHFFTGSFFFLIILLVLLFLHLFYAELIVTLVIILTIISIKNIKSFIADLGSLAANLNYRTVLIIQCLVIVVGASTAPYFFDALLYQLAIPYDYLQNHGFTYNPDSILTSYPMNANLFFAIGISFRSDMAAQLFCFLFTLMGCIAIKEFAEQTDNFKGASLAAVIYLTTPVISMTSLVPLVDTALAFYSLMAFMLLYHYFQSGKRLLFYSAGCAAGFALGIKHAFIPYIFPLSLLAFLLFQVQKNWKARLIDYIQFIIFSFIIMSPWLIKNSIIYSDPFYPYLSNVIASKMELARIIVPETSHFEWLAFLKSYLLLPVTMHFKLLGSAGILGGFFIAMFPWLFYSHQPKSSLFRYCLILSIAGLAVFIILPHSLRYFLPAFPFACILYGIGLPTDNSRITQLGKLIAWLCISINIIILVNHSVTFQLFNYSLQQENKAVFLSKYAEYYNAAEYLNKNAPRNAGVLLVGEDRTFYFHQKCYYNWLVQQPHLIELWLHQAGSVNNFLTLLKNKNVNYILFNHYGMKKHPDNLNRNSFYTLPLNELNLLNEFRLNHLESVYQDQFVTIMKIK